MNATGGHGPEWALVCVVLLAVGLGVSVVAAGGTAGAEPGGFGQLTPDEGPVGDDRNGSGGADLGLVSVDGPALLDPGEELVVEYTIENTGNATGTEGFVRFRVDGVTVGAASDVTVGPGERVTRTFTRSGFEFEAGDTVSYTVELTDFADSANGTASVTLPDQSGGVAVETPIETDSVSVSAEVTELTTANERGWVAIENLDTDPGPVVRAVTEGETARAKVTSLGGVALGDTIEVRLAADSEFAQPLDDDRTAVTAGDNAPISSFRSAPVRPEAGQQVRFDAGSSRGEAGAITEYRWDFTGDDGFEATTTDPTTSYTFGSAGQREVRLVVENEVGLTAEHTKPVFVEEQTTPARPAVAGIDIDGQGAAATITPGGAEISATVTNVGDETGRFRLTLTVGESVTRTRRTAALDGGSETTVAFGGATARLDAGSYDVTVSAANATASGTLTVEGSSSAASAFDIEIAGTNSPVTPGENLTATVVVESTGDGGSGTVSLAARELGSDSSAVTLDGGGSTETTLAVSTAGVAAGTYDLTVAVGDAEASTTATVGGSSGSSLVPVLLVALFVVLVLGVGAYVYTRNRGSGGGLDSL